MPKTSATTNHTTHASIATCPQVSPGSFPTVSPLTPAEGDDREVRRAPAGVNA
ncbi:hypothetical protein GCM10009872_32920 [Actinopolymorpha rutila]